MAGRAQLDAWWRLAHQTVGVAIRLGFRLRAAGLEHIPARDGAVLAYNHVSVLDPIIIALLTVEERGKPVHFLAVADAFELRVIGWGLQRIRAIPIRRGAGDWTTIHEAARTTRSGGLVGLAPEGKVGLGDELQPGQKGAARIALAANTCVIPVGIWGTQARWPKAGLRLAPPLRPPVVVIFGSPIRAEGDPHSRIDVRALTDRIMAGLDGMASRARALVLDDRRR
jgi:1-acyl-sn-glycerol-3-phosphate acyltransferase